MESINIKQRIKGMCVIGAMFILIVQLSEIFTGPNLMSDMLFHSPTFQISLLVVSWFFSPVFITVTNIDANRSIRANTFVILGTGLLIISLVLLATWLMT